MTSASEELGKRAWMPLRPLRWPRVIALALALAAVPTVLAWQHFQVEQDYHALWMLLHRARTQAMRAGDRALYRSSRRSGGSRRRYAGIAIPVHPARGALPDDPGR